MLALFVRIEIRAIWHDRDNIVLQRLSRDFTSEICRIPVDLPVRLVLSVIIIIVLLGTDRCISFLDEAHLVRLFLFDFKDLLLLLIVVPADHGDAPGLLVLGVANAYATAKQWSWGLLPLHELRPLGARSAKVILKLLKKVGQLLGQLDKRE